MKPGLILLIALAACAPKTVAAPEGGQGSKTNELEVCDAASASRFAGRVWNNSLGNEIMRATGSSVTRTIRPGQPVSMDYRTDRVNIELDGQDNVVRVSCG